MNHNGQIDFEEWVAAMADWRAVSRGGQILRRHNAALAWRHPPCPALPCLWVAWHLRAGPSWDPIVYPLPAHLLCPQLQSDPGQWDTLITRAFASMDPSAWGKGPPTAC